MTTDFVHLHVHTTYSPLDSTAKIVPLVKRARELGMKALAITDHGNLFGAKEFYDACHSHLSIFGKSDPIKPIIGCEVCITDQQDYTLRRKDEHRFHLCLHAKNETGYYNLVKLVSEAHVRGFYFNPRIDHSLLERHHEGLHCSSGCIAGEVAYYLDDGVYGGNDPEKAEAAARWYQDLFGDDFSLEVQLHQSRRTDVNHEQQLAFADLARRQKLIAGRMIELGDRLGIRVIATNDVHFIDPEDIEAEDVLLGIGHCQKFADENRLVYTGEEWLKSGDEMAELFADRPELISNTLEVADMIEDYHIDQPPDIPLFSGDINEDYRLLREKTMEGAKKRWGDPVPPGIVERLEFELETIKRVRSPGYMLIVADYVDAARRMDALVGPGRGSAAGSAIVYALGITSVDPIKHDLLVERFLNPDRIAMPDIDVDFDDESCKWVVDYIVKKYGAERVSQIAAFGKMCPRTAIKDVARFYDYPLKEANRLIGYVPVTSRITFEKALETSAELREAYDNGEPLVRKILRIAEKLDGCVRQIGVDASGLVISSEPIDTTVPVMTTEKSEISCTQYDGRYVETTGAVRYDILSLKTLSVIKKCLARIETSRGEAIDLDRIALDDQKTLELFANGDTLGVFQFESDGMRYWLKELKPECFSDLVALNAMYRPGPMDYIRNFVARKHGEEPVVYLHPLLARYTGETCGIVIYQEQVMLLARLLAGFTRGESDKLRRAMSKRMMDIVDRLKPKFISGCLANPEFRIGEFADEANARRCAEKIFADWYKFSMYAFNKSHAVSYSLLAYQTAYLKAHYPAEFCSALADCKVGNCN